MKMTYLRDREIDSIMGGVTFMLRSPGVYSRLNFLASPALRLHPTQDRHINIRRRFNRRGTPGVPGADVV